MEENFLSSLIFHPRGVRVGGVNKQFLKDWATCFCFIMGGTLVVVIIGCVVLAAAYAFSKQGFVAFMMLMFVIVGSALWALNLPNNEN